MFHLTIIHFLYQRIITNFTNINKNAMKKKTRKKIILLNIFWENTMRMKNLH